MNLELLQKIENIFIKILETSNPYFKNSILNLIQESDDSKNTISEILGVELYNRLYKDYPDKEDIERFQEEFPIMMSRLPAIEIRTLEKEKNYNNIKSLLKRRLRSYNQYHGINTRITDGIRKYLQNMLQYAIDVAQKEENQHALYQVSPYTEFLKNPETFNTNMSTGLFYAL